MIGCFKPIISQNTNQSATELHNENVSEKASNIDNNFFKVVLSNFEDDSIVIIEDNTFWIELENWGRVMFVSLKTSNDLSKINFYLVDENGTILYSFPEFSFDDETAILEIKFISVSDFNSDGFTDIVIIIKNINSNEKENILPYHEMRTYFQEGMEFIYRPEHDAKMNFLLNPNEFNKVFEFDVEKKENK